MNYKVTVSYDGTNFFGWAKQDNLRCVSSEIESILRKIYKKRIVINGSGRTDKYVHAIAQVFNFHEKELKMKPDKLLKALNSLAPRDIIFKNVEIVDEDFHARFSVKDKTYTYVLRIKNELVFSRNYEHYYDHKLHLDIMKKAAKLFCGVHDFASFSTSDLIDSKRQVNWIKFKKHRDFLKISINGQGFLRNMVRMICANILDVNDGLKTGFDLKKLLLNPKKGSSISKLPGCGLYLEKVNY